MMKNHKLVLPEHLNHYGFLFGGHMLKWVDEMAYIAVNIDFPGNDFVTISMDNVLFKHVIKNGDILCFNTRRKKLGNTSVSYCVKVRRECETEDSELVLFETNITFVGVDKDGNKQEIRR
jgi:acyl-CoA hydrolase